MLKDPPKPFKSIILQNHTIRTQPLPQALVVIPSPLPHFSSTAPTTEASARRPCSAAACSIAACSIVACSVAACSIDACSIAACSIIACSIAACSIAACSIAACSIAASHPCRIKQTSTSSLGPIALHLHKQPYLRVTLCIGGELTGSGRWVPPALPTARSRENEETGATFAGGRSRHCTFMWKLNVH